MSDWLEISGTEFVGVSVSLLILYAMVITLTRLFGLRSFSKMSAADFAMTIAVGTIFGGAIANPRPTVLVAALALTLLFSGQLFIAKLRRHSGKARALLDNEPIYLLKDGQLLPDNLSRTGVSVADVRAKLREANAVNLSQVAAVVFETTGDVTVLHGKDITVDQFVVHDVRGGP